MKETCRIARDIQQLAPMPTGWTYSYLTDGAVKDEVIIQSVPVIGQALVLVGGERTEMQVVVYDGDYQPQLLSEFIQDILDGMNTFPLGVKQPGERFELADVPREIEKFKRKLRKELAAIGVD